AAAGIAQRGASRPTRRWCTPRRAICRQSTRVTTGCTTARRSDSARPCIRRPQRAVEIAHLRTVLRIAEPARLYGWVPAEDAAWISGQAQPVLEFGAGPQPRVARSQS